MSPRLSVFYTIRITLFSLLIGLSLPFSSWADEAQDLYNQALSHVERQDFQQAAQSLQQAVQIFPRFAVAHHLLGVVLFTGLNQSDQAIQHLEQAVTLHHNFARAYLDLGLAHQHAGNMPKAKLALQKAVEIYPRYAEAQLNLAFVYDQMQSPQQAIDAYNAALKLNPKQPEALYNLAT